MNGFEFVSVTMPFIFEKNGLEGEAESMPGDQLEVILVVQVWKWLLQSGLEVIFAVPVWTSLVLSNSL